ncbi:MAG TPA: ATP-binding protein [Vicinamibacteria bacterium]|nr:ATP-binding protein [Vicinamibacteria bacterium]
MINVGHLSGWMRRRRASRRRFNPYIAGTPVFDRHLFFGRQQLALSTLRLLGSHSVTLTGERRIGKTSFLHHLQGVLAADRGKQRRFFPVFVDLEAVAAPGFFHAVMDETIEALALSPRTLATLRFSREHNGYQAEDFGLDLRRVVEELRQRTRDEVSLVLLIDEVDALREHPEQTGDPWLGSLLKSCPQEVRFVLAGVGRGMHAALDELELEPFTPEEAEALVKRPVAGVFRYEAQAVERILELSSLRPYLIQKLCLHAVNRMLDDGRTTVRLADVQA